MRRAIAGLLILATLVAGGGCRSGGIVGTNAGYLQFLGNTAGARFTLRVGNDAAPFTLVQTQQRYRVSPGRYALSVIRRGRTVLERPVEIASGQTLEITLP